MRVAPESEDELRFGEALDALLRQLAIMIVADGEGAAADRAGGRARRRAPRAPRRPRARSPTRPLVKAALHGGDPNWGRIVQAVGGALAAATPRRCALDVAIEGIQVCSAGAAIPYDEAALARAVQARRGRVRGRRCRARAPRPRCSSPTSRTSTCTVNAEYTT